MHALHKLLLATALTTVAYSVSCGEKIIDGTKAKKNSLQYMASVQNDEKHVCGGFLISPNFVLTAAHCDKSGNMSVILGAHNIKASGKKLQRYNVQRKYKHESYKAAKKGNDIMLLKLSRKVKLSKMVKTVKIPVKDKIINANTKCLVAGWGNTQQVKKPVDDLQVVDVLTVSLEVCKEQWGYAKFTLPDNVFCAGGYNTTHGACQGDSGGPLVCSGLAIGIVSFNLGGNCDYPNVPNVYTHISKFIPWIKKVIKGGS